MRSNPLRPKVKAAGHTTVGVALLAYALDLAGVDVDQVPAVVLIASSGALCTLAAYIKKDGLTGAWKRIINGASGEQR